LNALKQDLEKKTNKVNVVTIDLKQSSEVENLFKQISPFDYAINNAGIEGAINEIDTLSLADYNELFDTNVKALFLCLKYEVEHFKFHKKPGCIVNMASILGINGVAGSSLYVASKHAVIGFTKAVAVEQIQNNIRINCISPGATDTPMIRRVLGDEKAKFVGTGPANRMADPAEIAQSILWLCSPTSSYIVGHNLVIDGGRTVNLA
jgi:NAD(P)-dependent dehydrogenase (short-subunit alcohol dehydrogenase family)